MLGINSYQVQNRKFNKNQKSAQNTNFGRALTSDERKISNILLDRTNQINAVDLRAMVMPGAATPAYTIQGKDGKPLTVDTGVGSPFSKSAQDHILFSKDLMGINAVQQLPLGTISKGNYSPFSGSVFEIGPHLIDPGKMLDMKLVDEDDVKAFNVGENAGTSDKNTYQNFFDKNATFFEKAHGNFQKQLDADNQLKDEYNKFLEHPVHSQWIEKEATITALSKNLYRTDDYMQWGRKPVASSGTLSPAPDLDKILFSAIKDGQHPQHDDAAKRLAAIKEDPACKATMDLFKFKQFIAYKQNTELYNALSDHNIKNIADVPIGVHIKDTYGNHEAFMIDVNAKKSLGKSELGCNGGNGFNSWGVAAPKLDIKDSGDFISLKYKTALTGAHTARADAVWQLKTAHFRNFHDNDTSIKFEVLKDDGLIPSVTKAFKEMGKESEIKNIVAENLSDDSYRTDITGGVLNKYDISQIGYAGSPQIGKDGVSRVTLSNSDAPAHFWGTRGIHDHATLLKPDSGVLPSREKQTDIFAELLKGQCGDKGPRKVLFTFLDLFGRSDRYNGGDCNWMPRQTQNYEEEYYKNLAGEERPQTGLNAFKATKRAMEWKGIIKYENGNLINNADRNLAPDAKIVAELLQHFEGIVEEKGVYTTADANAKSAELTKGLHEKFGEKAVKLLVDGYAEHANKPNNEGGLKTLMVKVAKAVEEHRNVPAGTLVDVDAEKLLEEARNKAAEVPGSIQEGVNGAAKDAGGEISNVPSSSFKHGKLVAIGAGITVVGGLAAMYYSSQKKAEEEARKKHQVNHKKQYA